MRPQQPQTPHRTARRRLDHVPPGMTRDRPQDQGEEQGCERFAADPGLRWLERDRAVSALRLFPAFGAPGAFLAAAVPGCVVDLW